MLRDGTGGRGAEEDDYWGDVEKALEDLAAMKKEDRQHHDWYVQQSFLLSKH